MASFDLGRITRETDVRHVEFHETLDSTSKLAADLLSELLPLSPAVVLTSHQTAGRGRGVNAWWATTGALTFTLVLNADDIALAAKSRPLVSLAVGVAVRQIMADVLPNRIVSIKWPNDVYVGDRKLCGILTEQRVVEMQTAVLIGVGINVNNSLATASSEIMQRATSIFDLKNESIDLCQLLIDVLNSIANTISQLAFAPGEIVATINAHGLLSRRTVTIQVSDLTYSGHCEGVDNTGALVLELPTGKKSFVAGTVMSWSD